MLNIICLWLGRVSMVVIIIYLLIYVFRDSIYEYLDKKDKEEMNKYFDE